MAMNLNSLTNFFKTHPYFSYAKPEPEFAKELCFSNLNRVWIAFYGFFVIGLFFFVLRLALYGRFHNLPGYHALIILNTVIMSGSVGFILLFRSFMPECPEKINRYHVYLLYSSVLFFILVMSIASGVEYLGTGSLSRIFFSIVAICVFISINWYALLFYVFTGILTSVLTVFAFNGDVTRLSAENMHAPVILFVTWLMSRVFYLSSARDFYIRKELEKTNISLKEEIDSRLKIMETLEKSEKYMRVLFEKAPDAYMIYDVEQGVFVESNTYASELFLISSEEVYGKNYREIGLLSPEQIELADSIIEETLKNSYAGPYEFEIVRKDGMKIVIEMRSSLAMFQGRIILFGIARDITWRRIAEEVLKQANIDLELQIQERTEKFVETKERLKQEISDHRRTENVLRKTEEQSRALIANMNDGFALFEADMAIIYANQRLCAMLDVSWDHLAGKCLFDFVDHGQIPMFKSLFDGVDDKKHRSCDVVLVRKDGSRIDTIMSPAIVYGEDGSVESRFSVITDITRIKSMEAALRESEEMTRTLLDSSLDSVVMLKPDGTILLVNEKLSKNLNSTPEDLKGKNIFNLIRSINDSKRKNKLRDVIEKRESVIYEDLFFGRYYVLYIHPILDNGNSIERIAVFGRDVTDLKNAERHIHSLSQELIKVQEIERQRISRDLHDNVAQELASLKISCDTIFDSSFDCPRPMIQKMEGMSKILHHTIMNIRNMAYDLRPPGLDQLGLVRTINNYCDEYSCRNNIPVDFFSAGMTGLQLTEDAEINLYRIVQEALHNIVKHAGANQVVIRLIASFPTIILRVEDNGKGFDLKNRLESSYAEKRMGIRSMEERASILQGRIEIRSQVGKGTKIMVEIPVEANTKVNPSMEGDEYHESASI